MWCLCQLRFDQGSKTTMRDANKGVIRPYIIWGEAEVIKVQKDTAKGSE